MITLEYSGMWIGEKEGASAGPAAAAEAQAGEPGPGPIVTSTVTSVLGSPYGKIPRTARIPSRRLKRDVTKRY